MHIVEAMENAELFGPAFRGKSWLGWKIMLRGLFGLPMNREQAAFYRERTGRDDIPREQFAEAWLICGRRSGKSRISAFIAVYLACFIDWKPYLAAGETGTIMLLAADKKQASVLMSYVAGFLESIPILAKLVVNRTQSTVTLEGGIEIAIHTSSFRSVRGYSIVAALCDEIGFWMDGDSSNPATEILQALRPAMAQFPNALLLCFSSPYARRGALWESYQQYYGKSDAPVLVWQAPSRAMNPTVSQLTVMRARLRDAASARSEWDAEFRNDLESLFSAELIEGLMVPGRHELPPMAGTDYVAFTDPSGGQADSFTLAIAHKDSRSGKAVLDAIRETVPPFSPESVVTEYAELLRTYRINEVRGDRYAAEWCAEQFRKRGVNYRSSELSRSELYLSFLPMAMSGQMELVTHTKLLKQLTALERRTRTGGRDSVDHAPGGHDDVSNAVAGALVEALPRELHLGYVELVMEAMKSTARSWREHLFGSGPVLGLFHRQKRGRRSNENRSVVKARAAEVVEEAKCPECGGTACIVRRGISFHHNICGHDWSIPGTEREPKGQRREVIQNFRNGR